MYSEDFYFDWLEDAINGIPTGSVRFCRGRIYALLAQEDAINGIPTGSVKSCRGRIYALLAPEDAINGIPAFR
jgi:hypothetical protein